ncbi:hypothetical protein [Bartonella sp. CL162QHHD]|uniref:hypothetical protein n=1 Tax=Bartonella sp. CL162QHHD TaxID=3243516 RepID=UPI0035CF843E
MAKRVGKKGSLFSKWSHCFQNGRTVFKMGALLARAAGWRCVVVHGEALNSLRWHFVLIRQLLETE